MFKITIEFKREKIDVAPNIRDNAWVDKVPGPNPGDRDRYAVVVRVPGNRKAPSALVR